MKVVGITGTNGKTTCVHLICHLLKHKVNCASFGTLGIYHYIGNSCLITKTNLTTLGNIDLHDNLQKVQEKDCKLVALEASSHGLQQNRVAGVDFSKVAFTNLSHDHLDYHKNMENYFKAKLKLFTDYTKKLQQVIINLDDEYGVRLTTTLIDFFVQRQLTQQIEIIGYSTKSAVQLQKIFLANNWHSANIKTISCESINFNQNGIVAFIKTPWGDAKINYQLLGIHNLSNLLASIAICADELPFMEIINQIKHLSAPQGRLEKVANQNITLPVIVDYAHSPIGLDHAIQAIKKHYNNQNICCVFGCGGDRDIFKRPKMLAAALKYCNAIVVTQDNSRFEDPKKIMNDIINCGGVNITADIVMELDRKRAIYYAIENYSHDHIILIAGKGHEAEQIIGEQRLAFCDNTVAQQALNSINL
jgi:UDP-N-acetylmuramoyl-L-alanyl-D-glutamate--2,6-diaminopimelate ligase